MEKTASADRNDIVTWYRDVYCDVIEPNHTKEIEQLLKVGDNVDVMNQSKQQIESCDCSSNSIFYKESRDTIKKTVFRIAIHQIATNCRGGRSHFMSSEAQEYWISILILVVALDLILFYSWY